MAQKKNKKFSASVLTSQKAKAQTLAGTPATSVKRIH